MTEDKSRVLVTYTTNAGSTKEVAERIAGHIAPAASVDVLPVEEVGSLNGYAGVVIGAPMILGWHRKARKFYRKHRNELRALSTHVFMTAMRVTDSADKGDVTVDPKILVSPGDVRKLSLKERLTAVRHYVAPLNGTGRGPQPESIAIFGGKLDYTRLKLFQMLFVMVVIGEAPADKRNWELIERWAGGLSFGEA